MNNTTDNPVVVQPQSLYDLYGNTGPSADLITNVGIRWICATIAALANLSVVYVTVKSKNLRSPCNVLISFDSLYAGIYELSVTNTFVIVVTGTNFVRLYTCLPLQLLPILGFFLSQGGALAIAVDRLICMLFPIWINKNQRKHKKVLVPVMVTACALYALYAIVLCIGYSLENGKKFVQCGTGECFPDFPDLNVIQLILLGITVGCYPLILLAIMLRRKTANVAAVSYTRKMVKSLMSIVLVLLASQALAALSRLLGLQPANASSGVGFFLANAQVCLKYLAYGCNAPILYGMSAEYRKAYNSVIFHKETATSVAQIMSTTVNQQQQGNANNNNNITNNNWVSVNNDRWTK